MLLIHFKTLFSFDFYRRASLAPKKGLAWWSIYLVFLSLIVLYFASGTFVKKSLPLLLKNFPVVTFENGVLTAPKNPVRTEVPNTPFTLVFDASGNAAPPAASAQNPVLWVHGNTLYLLNGTRAQTQLLPKEMNFTTDQPTLEKYQSTLAVSFRLAALLAGLFLVPFVMLLSFALAFATGLMFKLMRMSNMPLQVLMRWALFLLGPLSILWYIHLWVHIPLFSLAQLILCIIYMQQIFNGEFLHAH